MQEKTATLLKWLTEVLKQKNPSSNITNIQQLSNGEKLLQALHQMHPIIWTKAPSPYHSTWDSIVSGLRSFYESIQIYNLTIDYYDVE